MLGDDRSGEPREEGQARQENVGQKVQRFAFHELETR